MSLISRYCHPISLAEGSARLAEGKLPSRAVAVTFDDGYRDNAEIALPILLRNRVPATFFVSTGFLDGGRMWNDSIIEGVRRTTLATIEGSELGLGRLELTSLDGRRVAAEAVIKAVKHRTPEVRQRLVDEFCSELSGTLPDNLMMSRSQVRALAAAGMEIGAHTVSHPILRMLTDEQARREIAGSREELESIIGAPVTSFAYPNGRPGSDYSARDRDLVASLGFARAVSTRMAVAVPTDDPWQLPRFSPWDRVPARWLARLLLYYART